MAETTGLEIQKLPANPVEGDVQVNAAFDLIDAATQQNLTINFASDADLTLTTTGTIAQWQYSVLRFTDSGVVLTTGRNVIVPVNKRTYRIINNTAQTLTVKTSAGTGIAVLSNTGKMLQCDGTNVIDVLPGSGGGITDVVLDTTPQLGGALDTNSQQIRESKGTDIASAATLTIPANGNFFDVTGTATITALSAVAVGTEITLQFDAVLTLTHSAIDLILPTAANITTTAGDTAIFREYAAGDWLCVSYQKANGESLAGTAASVLDMPVQSKAVDYTLLLADKGNLINVDASGAPRTITLIAAATAGDGYTIAVKKTDATANTVTIDGSGTETIDGATTKTITSQNDTLFLTCNGSAWFILAEPATGSNPTESLILPVSDETTALTVGTAKVTFRMPYAFTLSAVRASVGTAPTGATIIVDINEGGTTILSTKLTIDASEKTSTTAATAAVISDTALADDAEITIDIDQVGSTIAGAGLKVTLIGVQA